MAAAAEAVVFRRCATVLLDGFSVILDERDAHSAPIRAVSRNLEARRPYNIHLLARFTTINAVAERAGRTGPHGLNDVIQPCTARRHERLLPLVKYGWEAIAAV